MLAANRRLGDSEEPGFFSKAWKWVKDIDYEKWFGVLKTVATVLAVEQEHFVIKPSDAWARYGDVLPQDLYANTDWS